MITLTERKPPPPPPKKDPLFAIAMNVSIRGGPWKPRIEYLHAKDAGDARVQYLQSECMAMKAGTFRVDIVGVSHVIGYFVNDNKGDILSV